MKLHAFRKRVLSVLVVIVLVFSMFRIVPATAASQFITDIQVAHVTTTSFRVSFHYGKNGEDDSVQSLVILVRNNAGVVVALHDFEPEGGTDARGDYSATLSGLQPGTAYTAWIHGSVFTSGWLGNTDHEYASDPIPVSTLSMETPVLTLQVDGLSDEEVFLKGTMVSSGTGVNNTNAIRIEDISIIRASDNHPTEDIFAISDYYEGKIVATTGSRTTDPVFPLQERFAGLEPGTAYLAQTHIVNTDGMIGFSPKVMFTTLSRPVIAKAELISSFSDRAVVKGTITEMDGRDVLLQFNAFCKAGSNPINDPAAIKGRLVDFDTGTKIGYFLFEGLSPETSYQCVLNTVTHIGDAYSTQNLTFSTTPLPRIATVVTEEARFVTAEGARLDGVVSHKGYTGILEHGIVFSATDSSPERGEAAVTDLPVAIISQTEPIDFSAFPTGLLSDTSYAFRAYARNSEGTSYGVVRHFTTEGAPAVTLTGVEDVSDHQATAFGNVQSTGGIQPTLRGFVYSVSPNPMLADGKSAVALSDMTSADTGAFQMSLTALSSGTDYRIKAFVVNQTGVRYSAEDAFTTDDTATSLPLVTTLPTTGVLDVQAFAGGTATTTEGTSLSSKGAIWSVLPNPVLGGPATASVASASEGSPFTFHLTGLQPDTTYFYRAYAINENGIGYGAERTFQTTNTIGAPGKPIVGDTTTAGIGRMQADATVEVLSSGTVLFNRRLVYSASDPEPLLGEPGVTEMNFGVSGMTVGLATIHLNGLVPQTTYYVRGYASNDSGFSYGPVSQFVTLPPGLPEVHGLALSGITRREATLQAGFRANGAAIVETGVVYSMTNPHPGLGDPESVVMRKSAAIDGDGSDAMTMMDLVPDTDYFCTAFARNATGLAYGETKTFVTHEVTDPGSEIEAAVAGKRQASLKLVLQETGGHRILEVGAAYGTGPDPALGGDGVLQVKSTLLQPGSENVQISGLQPMTDYQARPYVITDTGVFYGDSMMFSTLMWDLPQVRTYSVLNASGTNCDVSAGVVTEGDADPEVTLERGIVWNLHGTPILGGAGTTSTVDEGTGIGGFVVGLTDLPLGEICHIRAFAVTDKGTAYGEELTHTPQRTPATEPEGTPQATPQSTPGATAGVTQTIPTPEPIGATQGNSSDTTMDTMQPAGADGTVQPIPPSTDPVPQTAPDINPEPVLTEQQVPEGAPLLPKTAGLPWMTLTAMGAACLGLGYGMKRRN